MNKLTPDTARLISSLQVITKVENVVKELVENALDAGATCIEVKFENYGLSKIEVRDNGSGIEQSGIEFVAQRHFTSKISCKEDLNCLQSYGFRGEALSSLCDVSEVFLTTRTKADTFSTKHSFDNKGHIVATKPCHLVQGTTVTANNLFSKMPVRCQYYQSQNKRKQILKGTEDVLMAFALIHPEKRFSFIHNKCVIWQKPMCKDLQSTLENVIGSSVVSQMVKVEHKNEDNGIHLCAYIPTTRATRQFRKLHDRCFLFVNKRPVHDKEIEKMVKKHTSLTSELSSSTLKWPAFFLSIELPLERVDSNVESDKSRVMISDKELLLTAVDQMLFEAYSSLPVDDHDMGKENNFEQGFSNINKTYHEDADGINLAAQTCEQSLTNDVLQVEEASAEINAVASDWSKGHAVIDEEGRAIQPARIISGGQPKVTNRPENNASSFQRSTFAKTSQGINSPFSKRNSSSEESFSENTTNRLKSAKLNQSILDVSGFRSPATNVSCYSRTPTRGPGTTPSRKRKALSPVSDDVHNASLITQWVSETGDKKLASAKTNNEVCVTYAEGQEVYVNFDLKKIQENLCYKKDYQHAEKRLYSCIGALKDVKGGVILDNVKNKLFLVNLLRLQEAKLFWSLMENHSLQTKELSNLIIVEVAALSTEEKMGLKKLKFSSTDFINPNAECIDDRICKNGFKMRLVEDLSGGTESLQIYGMTNCISYYNFDDLKCILRKIGSSDKKITLRELRSFKLVQYLQAEAVRMSYSLPVHLSILDSLEELEKYFPPDFVDWKCFHDKPIFHLFENINIH